MKAYWWILIALLAFTGLMMALFGVVGGLVIGVAIFSVVGVMYIVLQEKHDHEEHYIVPPPSEQNNPQ
ncbi:MAG: hypothetical protein J0M07_19555 [Anaerolineae bacterium]|jgi:hypothetical protein|uniref:hypothetical protein n=1 Tax=Candidatus Flexifilum breve TaxID=3140694 RepID=UPI001ACB822B|nr:hypothetical protein [Chloroflexota bacterium]MBK9747183.1 hypothetical protein [Chloroflexota bacterium]MBN8637528.1 hypothetical protein [Anaerolineae bacterium]